MDDTEFGALIAVKVKEAIARAVEPLQSRIAELESRKPEKGEKGDAGPQGERGPEGAGIAGRDGRDGQHGTQGEKGMDGKDGAHGRDGIDGFNLSDFDAQLADDCRTVLLSFGDGERAVHKLLKFPVVIDRGVFSDSDYAKGDGVTFGGSFWIAQKDTPEGKPGTSSDWRLSIKKGRDGKPGENGKDFAPPKPVKLP